MKKQMVKAIRGLFVSILLFSILFQANIMHVSAYEEVPTAGVAINGKMVDGINPIKLNGTYYLPLIYIAKILGYNDIRFESKTKTYEITDGSTVVRVTMGGNRARKGNEYINVEPPRWINETAYTSLAATSALFNSFIYFKPENGSIQVERPATRYRIQKGDTLWLISKSHHTTVSALKKENNLTSNIIYPGHVIKLQKRI